MMKESLLSDWFLKSGLSKKFIERETGISTSALTKYLNGSVQPNPKTIKKLLDVFSSAGYEFNVKDYYESLKDIGKNGRIFLVYCAKKSISIQEFVKGTGKSNRVVSSWMKAETLPTTKEKEVLLATFDCRSFEEVQVVKECKSCGKEVVRDSYQFCPQCGFEVAKMFNCNSCKAELATGSKFCSTCGEPVESVTEKKKVKPVKKAQLPPPSDGVTIEFKFSTAMSFENALLEAQDLEGFEQYGEGKKAVYRVNAKADDLLTLSVLVEKLAPMRSKSVYIDQELTPWDDIFGFVGCLNLKLKSYKPEYYCFGYDDEDRLNPWGCLHTGIGFLYHHQWFKWGNWLNEAGDWAFDKSRIRHRIEKDLYSCKNCPSLDLEHVEKILEALPDVVNPNNDENWEFERGWRDEDEGLEIVAEWHGVLRKEVMVGVKPKAKKVIKKLLQDVYGHHNLIDVINE